MMTVPTLILAALAAQALPAPDAVRWELMAEESDGPSFVDPASIQRDGDIVRYLNRTDRVGAPDEEVQMIVVRLALDCRRRTLGLVVGDAYGEGGRFLRTITGDPGGPTMRPLAPGAGPDRVIRRVCGAAGRR